MVASKLHTVLGLTEGMLKISQNPNLFFTMIKFNHQPNLQSVNQSFNTKPANLVLYFMLTLWGTFLNDSSGMSPSWYRFHCALIQSTMFSFVEPFFIPNTLIAAVPRHYEIWKQHFRGGYRINFRVLQNFTKKLKIEMI